MFAMNSFIYIYIFDLAVFVRVMGP